MCVCWLLASFVGSWPINKSVCTLQDPSPPHTHTLTHSHTPHSHLHTHRYSSGGYTVWYYTENVVHPQHHELIVSSLTNSPQSSIKSEGERRVWLHATPPNILLSYPLHCDTQIYRRAQSYSSSPSDKTGQVPPGDCPHEEGGRNHCQSLQTGEVYRCGLTEWVYL